LVGQHFEQLAAANALLDAAPEIRGQQIAVGLE
jgi:hypothetical protein